jgi:hypothetical protein
LKGFEGEIEWRLRMKGAMRDNGGALLEGGWFALRKNERVLLEGRRNTVKE